MLRYGGGGHARVGTCQVAYVDADRVVGELLQAVRAGFPPSEFSPRA
jgi:nanoRNase/pAp phosphatase (c-di-AMP/oligoRNAs hydrolase)